MRNDAYSEISRIEEVNWYYRGKRDLICGFFKKYNLRPNKILDVGAGVGTNIKVLETFSQMVDGLESSATAIKEARKKGINNIHLGDAIQYHNSGYDFILCSDILEHVDDRKLLENLTKLLVKGGYLLIAVPAFPFLWGVSDQIAWHRKRYTMKSIQRLLGEYNFHIVFINYWNSFAFIPTVIYRYFFEKFIFKILSIEPKGQLSNIPSCLNKPLYWLVRLENYFCLRLPFPFGVDIVALVKK